MKNDIDYEGCICALAVDVYKSLFGLGLFAAKAASTLFGFFTLSVLWFELNRRAP